MATSRGPKKPIGQILLDRGLITQEQLDEALTIQTSTTEKLGRILVDRGYVKEKDVLGAYAEQIGVPFVELDRTQIDEQAAKSIPQSMIQRHSAIPIRREGNRLVVAMADPTNVFALDDIRLMTGYEVEPVLASAEDIAAIQRSDSGGAISDESLQTALQALGVGGGGATSVETEVMAGAGADEDVDRATQLAEEAPIIRVVNVIIQTAIKERASDIHIEPDRRGVRVRYRIDGVLHERMNIPKYVHAPLISRIKIMADMNIAERRVPLDGRIHVRHEGKDYDLRVSTLPTVFGEKAVMRILDQSSVLIGLARLGMFPEVQADVETVVVQPNGMFLSTGPTGSGKTTTQYAILNKINSVEKNIITIEDPVEYQLPGINQVHVNRKAGLTFANAMRHFLRQDPDIIMVGEIRDLETAEIAVQAALTGHLVLSTLHTNDAPSAVTRLVDMGVEPFLISASVAAVLAQRLARKICPNCKEQYRPPMEALTRVGFRVADAEDVVFYRGRGCEQCMHTGYYGRTGIFEMMLMNEEIQDLVVKRAPLSEVVEAAIANGMKTLRQDGFEKVVEGITTIEEVMRVVFTQGTR
ncbi:MAG: Flp pilus assembly complex ATPase component TadA [Armatimonadota bacterium]|nr:MAG: Flp pilus assembly complex ATPase component TadA [Armatimonadota bacterium]